MGFGADPDRPAAVDVQPALANQILVDDRRKYGSTFDALLTWPWMSLSLPAGGDRQEVRIPSGRRRRSWGLFLRARGTVLSPVIHSPRWPLPTKADHPIPAFAAGGGGDGVRVIQLDPGRSGVATGLFDEVGAMGVNLPRTLISAVLLVLIWRPSFRLDRGRTRDRPVLSVLCWLVMNLLRGDRPIPLASL